MHIISVVNQKGGVGKTSISVNLAACLARMKHRVLLMDLDIQNNATLNLLGVVDNSVTIADCFLDEIPINEVIVKTPIERLDMAPSGEKMAVVELNIYPKMARESLLKKAITNIAEYDYVIIDLPPFLSLLTINALNCSQYALVPVNTTFFSIYGIRLLNETIEQIREHLNPQLQILGYVINAYDRRETETYTVEESLRESLGDQVLKTVIRTNTAIKQSQGERQTIFQYEGEGGKGVVDFTHLAKEISKRIKSMEQEHAKK